MSAIKVTGDFGELREMTKRLAVNRMVISRAAVMGADFIQPLLNSTVSGGCDAYGRPWAPRIADGGTVSVRGQAARVLPTQTTVKATVTRKAPRYLDRGRKGKPGKRGGSMAARPIIPRGDAIPVAWLVALDEAISQVLGPSFIWYRHTAAKQAAAEALVVAKEAKRQAMDAKRKLNAITRRAREKKREQKRFDKEWDRREREARLWD
jgi:hypothetical protein